MSDTPRTDAEFARAMKLPYERDADDAMLAWGQQLERELSAQTQRAENIERQTRNWLNRCTVLQWIPVGERLPETMTDVLILVRVSEGVERIYAGCRYSDHWHTESEAIIHPKVLAWCPWPTAPTL